MYLTGLDLVLLKMINFKLTLFPLSGLHYDPYIYSKAYPSYQVDNYESIGLDYSIISVSTVRVLHLIEPRPHPGADLEE
jgi:hypothetical protein